MSEPRASLARFERTVTLRDGTRVLMRPIRPDDAARLIALYDELSRDTGTASRGILRETSSSRLLLRP